LTLRNGIRYQVAVNGRRVRQILTSRTETVVGIVIVLISVFGAYVTWRAAVAAGTASDSDQQSRQAGVLSQQYRSEDESAIAYDARLFKSFESHVLQADALERDARRLGGAVAARLRHAARAERATARAISLPFDYSPVDAKTYRPSYAEAANLAKLVAGDVRLTQLRPQRLKHAADQARDKRLSLVAVDTAVIASIFFLTLSLLAARLRREFGIAGVGLATLAGIAFVVLQIVIAVPET
jgi:hypothetical protein